VQFLASGGQHPLVLGRVDDGWGWRFGVLEPLCGLPPGQSAPSLPCASM